MSFKSISLTVCTSLVTCSVFAQNTTDQIIDSFLNCDSQFFHVLAENQSEISKIVDLSTTPDGTVYIPVKNVEEDDDDTVMFKTPIEYKGLKLIGYQNIYASTTLFGKYYYWGFVIDNSITQVKNAINNFDWHQYSSETFIADPEIYDRQNPKSGWQHNPYIIDGTIPKRLTIEKSIYLEPIKNNKVHLVCSLQGDIDSGLLYQFRPDMKFIEQNIKEKRKETIEKLKLKHLSTQSATDKNTQSTQHDTNRSEN